MKPLKYISNNCLPAIKNLRYYLMYRKYPLFQSHLDLAHHYWSQLVIPGDLVIDATCGNGHDTLLLAKLALSNTSGQLFAIDIQEKAIHQTRSYLSENIPLKQISRITFIQNNHVLFPSSIVPQSVKLIVYNLGYLPGGDKRLTTLLSSTLQSVKNANSLIMLGGAISITCYPGHLEGKREENELLELVSQLSPNEWSCCHHRWLNRSQAPSLLLLQKTF